MTANSCRGRHPLLRIEVALATTVHIAQRETKERKNPVDPKYRRVCRVEIPSIYSEFMAFSCVKFNRNYSTNNFFVRLFVYSVRNSLFGYNRLIVPSPMSTGTPAHSYTRTLVHQSTCTLFHPSTL